METSLDVEEERGGRVGNEAVIQVQGFLFIVPGRRRKAGLACQYLAAVDGTRQGRGIQACDGESDRIRIPLL
ncbi:hypothetical protein [Nitrosospira sp. Nsp2]|uniref:hypothetical protein n=1 Tax=Nitrosospira sp. Nsp2 TaxID=136548 RepID=UPI002159B01E|nr:hypothetical protein [Nitrosospira sp. Nsp2]